MKSLLLLLALAPLTLAAQFDELPVYKVKTTHEFIQALGNDREIVLAPGTYDFTRVNTTTATDHFYFGYPTDTVPGRESPFVHHLSNVIIRGSGIDITTFVFGRKFGPVIQFEDCLGIELRDFSIHHINNGRFTYANVLEIHHCENVVLENIKMDGIHDNSGLGIVMSKTVTVRNLEISRMWEYIFSIHESVNVTVEDSYFHDNLGYMNVGVGKSSNVQIVNCRFLRNGEYHETHNVNSFFNMGKNIGVIQVMGCTVSGNTAQYLANFENEVSFEDCTITDNRFHKGTYRWKDLAEKQAQERRR